VAKAKRPPQTKKKLGGPKVGGDGPRQNKVDTVADFKDRLGTATAVILSEYRGMTVGELAELRASLRDADADYKIIKNTLATIATREAGLDDLAAQFEGPTAFTFTRGDPVTAAKKLSDFAKKVPTLVLKGGILDRKVLSAKDVTALGSLESREVMLTKAAGMFISPIQKLANLFAAPLNQLGAVLAQLRDKMPAEGGAPAATETPAAETPAAEAPAAEAPAAEAPAAEAPEAQGAPEEAAAPEAAAPEAAAPEAEAAPVEAPPAEAAGEQAQEQTEG
jgi:large subunit ribosomal protein L10